MILVGADGRDYPLTVVLDDAANPLLEASVDDKIITVEVWRGAPAEEISRLTRQGIESWDDLARASLDPTAKPQPDEGTLSMPSGPVDDLVTFAAAVDDGSGQVERMGMSTRGAVLSVNEAESSRCLRAPSSASVNLSQSDRSFDFPTREVQPMAKVSSEIVRYKTFIPAAKANGLTCGWFKGDNRGFSSSGTTSDRTRAVLYFTFSPTPSVTWSRSIGTTHKINPNTGAILKSATASSAGIKFSGLSQSATYGRAQVNHSVGNPLCSIAGPISYSVVVEAYVRGGAGIAGTIKKVPNHEAYVYPTGLSAKTIFRRSHADFLCLNLNCGNESIWESV